MDGTRAGCIRVVFKVYKHCVDTAGCVVALLGSHSCLGQWRVDDALISQHTGLCEWHIDTMLPKSAMLGYKLLLLDSRTRHVLHEEMFTRYLDTDETPMHVELTYGDFSCKKTPIDVHMRTGIQEIGEPRLNMDYFLWNPQEQWQMEVKTFHSKVGSALEHYNAKFGTHHLPRQARSMESACRNTETYRDRLNHTESSTKLNVGSRIMKYLMPRTTRKPSGLSMDDELTQNTPSSSWWSSIVGNRPTGDSTMGAMGESISAEAVPDENEKAQDQTDKELSLRQMLPSPYRMAMLGLAVGACIYCKIKK